MLILVLQVSLVLSSSLEYRAFAVLRLCSMFHSVQTLHISPSIAHGLRFEQVFVQDQKSALKDSVRF